MIDDRTQIQITIYKLGEGFVVDVSDMDMNSGCGGGGQYATSTFNEAMSLVLKFTDKRDTAELYVAYDPEMVFAKFPDHD